MTIERKYSIDYQNLKEGKYDFHIGVSDDLFTLSEESPVREGALIADIKLLKIKKNLELDVEIRGNVSITCDRCLENMSLPICYSNHLTVRVGGAAEEYDGEVMWLDGSENYLSLAQYLYESVILSLPYSRVHGDIADCNQDMINRLSLLEAKVGGEVLQAEIEETVDGF